MQTRENAVALIHIQLSDANTKKHSGSGKYGIQELRQLLDFIYDAPPASEAAFITTDAVKALSDHYWQEKRVKRNETPT